ncbi:MAG: hypothetical protein H6657_09230 [Ardenticatenaceae bacterium]|nr:hypothetical protein [Ardenticatenaceae bacterium]
MLSTISRKSILPFLTITFPMLALLALLLIFEMDRPFSVLATSARAETSSSISTLHAVNPSSDFALSPENPPVASADILSLQIMIDNFEPLVRDGDPISCCNLLGGDRGSLANTLLSLGSGTLTATVASGSTLAGHWQSLAHPDGEQLGFDTTAVLPKEILPAYQASITGLEMNVSSATAGSTFHIELKNGTVIRWQASQTLGGGQETLYFPLSALGYITNIVWYIDNASPGDHVAVDSVSFTAETAVSDTATQAFLWSYGMLLDNWSSSSGMVRDKAQYPAGDFDAVQATGSLAAATAQAAQLGFVSQADAINIVTVISNTLLLELPRFHGLWPHFVTISPPAGPVIAPGTEYSSVDSAITAFSLYSAQFSLGMQTNGTEQFINNIDWVDLLLPNGLSHGYDANGTRLTTTWDTFGGESWLVALAYAAATGSIPPLANSQPPTYNGAAFIDDLPFLWIESPAEIDVWGTDWSQYLLASATQQTEYFKQNYPNTCYDSLGLFGLSAAEVPEPALVLPADVYQAFGVGGRIMANDGSSLFGTPVIVPHAVGLLALEKPLEALSLWTWLVDNNLFTPLNNVESFLFIDGNTSCTPDSMRWNSLKGSWNLALQTVGWGNYLLRDQGPALWLATRQSPYLYTGYLVLVPNTLPWLTLNLTQVREDDNVNQAVDIPFSLDWPSPLPITLTYSFEEGTAMAGSDFLPSTTLLSLEAGSTQGNLNVSLIGDDLPEGDELFAVQFSDLQNVRVSSETVPITILNDDYLLYLSLILNDSSP